MQATTRGTDAGARTRLTGDRLGRKSVGVWRRWAIVVVALASSIGAATVAASPAQASATGCALYTGTYGGFWIPAGQYCFGVNGSGLTINRTSGSFNGPVMYNWSETVRFLNTQGSVYATYNSSTTSGPSYGYHLWTRNISGTAQPGKVCGQLKSSGIVIAQVCHNIYP